MRNEQKISATRLFSMIKNKLSNNSVHHSDNKNNKNEKEKDRGEFLKRLIQTDEDNNQEKQHNYNVYSKSNVFYLNDNKNDSYRNSIKHDSEKIKKTNSIIGSKKLNNSSNKESDDSEEKNEINSDETKKQRRNKKKK